MLSRRHSAPAIAMMVARIDPTDGPIMGTIVAPPTTISIARVQTPRLRLLVLMMPPLGADFGDELNLIFQLQYSILSIFCQGFRQYREGVMNLKYQLWITTVESIDNSIWLCYNGSIQGTEHFDILSVNLSKYGY